MAQQNLSSGHRSASWLAVYLAFSVGIPLVAIRASGGSGSGGSGSTTPKADTIKVSKCYYDAPSRQMLINASSSGTTAHLYAYQPNGTYQGEVQNGGGSRYGGTFMGWIKSDPGSMIIKNSSGGSITAPTTPFQP